jgi:hypothetical protein
MNFFRRHVDGWIAFGLFGLTFSILFLDSPRMGTTRDESFYFNAAESYAGWFRELAKNPSQALQEPAIRQAFENNREHPVLFKNLMALSSIAFGPEPSKREWPPQHPGRATLAMRIPAFFNAGLLIALIYLLGVSMGNRRVGLFAALSFLLAPRHFFHLHLACFDMPITTAWLAAMMAYRKARHSIGWGILSGLVFGIALAVKLNAFFIPVVLLLHWLITERKQFSFSRKGLSFPRIPFSFFSMAILGPLFFFAHWPFLWHSTFERLGWYFNFHLRHVNYPWEYFGTLLTDPPFPWLYPFAVTALTLPGPTLLLGTWGFFSVLGERLGHPLRSLLWFLGRFAGLFGKRDSQPVTNFNVDEFDGWLLLLNAFIPIFIIAIPSVPIFGGVKHWLPAMPFFCVLAGMTLDRILAALPEKWSSVSWRRSLSFGVVGSLALLPSLLGTLHIGPYGTSFYNELAGGIDGAADLGMQRQYWSNNVVGVFPWINQHLPQNAKLYLHEVTFESFRTYQLDGLLRPDIRMAWSPEEADYTAYQTHREFTDVEHRVWSKTGTRKILTGLYLDEVPIILVYGPNERGPGA